MTIDCIIPARDEATTVADNVVAALECRYVREVIVVDDGSSDATADVARAAGAKVLAREAPCGSKAHAMDLGLAVSDAEAVLFVDGDCIGLTASHLDAICEPFIDGRAAMSIGVFDYGWLRSWLVLRWPPLTGERIIPRWVWDAIPEEKLDGYTIEVRINEVVAEHRLPTAARTMRGVSHRTKRDKHGRWEGVRRTWAMYREVVATIWPFGDVRARTHWFYLRALTIEGD